MKVSVAKIRDRFGFLFAGRRAVRAENVAKEMTTRDFFSEPAADEHPPTPLPEPEPAPEPAPPAPEPEPPTPEPGAPPPPQLRPVPSPEPVPPAEPEPVREDVLEPVAYLPRDGGEPREWNIWELERLAREGEGRDVGRDPELAFLLLELRQFANADGQLPVSFDAVVRESFGELLYAAV
jgi:hypothetical protein